MRKQLTEIRLSLAGIERLVADLNSKKKHLRDFSIQKSGYNKVGVIKFLHISKVSSAKFKNK